MVFNYIHKDVTRLLCWASQPAAVLWSLCLTGLSLSTLYPYPTTKQEATDFFIYTQSIDGTSNSMYNRYGITMRNYVATFLRVLY